MQFAANMQCSITDTFGRAAHNFNPLVELKDEMTLLEYYDCLPPECKEPPISYYLTDAREKTRSDPDYIAPFRIQERRKEDLDRSRIAAIQLRDDWMDRCTAAEQRNEACENRITDLEARLNAATNDYDKDDHIASLQQNLAHARDSEKRAKQQYKETREENQTLQDENQDLRRQVHDLQARAAATANAPPNHDQAIAILQQQLRDAQLSADKWKAASDHREQENQSLQSEGAELRRRGETLQGDLSRAEETVAEYKRMYETALTNLQASQESNGRLQRLLHRNQRKTNGQTPNLFSEWKAKYEEERQQNSQLNEQIEILRTQLDSLTDSSADDPPDGAAVNDHSVDSQKEQSRLPDSEKEAMQSKISALETTIQNLTQPTQRQAKAGTQAQAEGERGDRGDHEATASSSGMKDKLEQQSEQIERLQTKVAELQRQVRATFRSAQEARQETEKIRQERDDKVAEIRGWKRMSEQFTTYFLAFGVDEAEHLAAPFIEQFPEAALFFHELRATRDDNNSRFQEESEALKNRTKTGEPPSDDRISRFQEEDPEDAEAIDPRGYSSTGDQEQNSGERHSSDQNFPTCNDLSAVVLPTENTEQSPKEEEDDHTGMAQV